MKDVVVQPAIGERLGTLCSRIGAGEVIKLMKLWGQVLSNDHQVLLALDYAFLLVSFADRIAFPDAEDGLARTHTLNTAIDTIKDLFCLQEYCGDTKEERAEIFERLFKVSFEYYRPCRSLDSFVEKSAARLVATSVAQPSRVLMSETRALIYRNLSILKSHSIPMPIVQ